MAILVLSLTLIGCCVTLDIYSSGHLGVGCDRDHSGEVGRSVQVLADEELRPGRRSHCH